MKKPLHMLPSHVQEKIVKSAMERLPVKVPTYKMLNRLYHGVPLLKAAFNPDLSREELAVAKARGKVQKNLRIQLKQHDDLALKDHELSLTEKMNIAAAQSLSRFVQ